MDDLTSRQSGRIPVLLATPIPDNADYRPLALYLRNLQLAGIIDLHVPTHHSDSTFYYRASGALTPFTSDQFISPEELHAQVEPHSDLDEFYAVMNQDLKIRNQQAVVIFGSSTSVQEVGLSGIHRVVFNDRNGADVPVQIDVGSRRLRTGATFPLASNCDMIKVASAIELDHTRVPKEVEASAARIAEEFVKSLPAIVRDRGEEATSIRKGELFVIDGNFVKISDGKSPWPYPQIGLREFKEVLTNLISTEMVFQWTTSSVDVPLETAFLRAGNPQDLILKLREAVAKAGHGVELPTPDSIEQQGYDLKQLHVFTNEIEANRDVIATMQETYDAIVPELDKKMFGGKKIRAAITDIAKVAAQSSKTLDIFREQYGTLDNPKIPLRDQLRILSTVYVHEKAAELLRAIQKVPRGRVDYGEVLSRIPASQVAERELAPIGERRINNIVINLCTTSERATQDELNLIDVVDEAHDFAVSGSIAEVEEYARVQLSAEELKLYDSSRRVLKASERAAGLSRGIQSMRDSSLIARMGEVEAATPLEQPRNGQPDLHIVQPDIGEQGRDFG